MSHFLQHARKHIPNKRLTVQGLSERPLGRGCVSQVAIVFWVVVLIMIVSRMNDFFGYQGFLTEVMLCPLKPLNSTLFHINSTLLLYGETDPERSDSAN